MIQVGDFKLGADEKKAINEVIKSGRITEGKKTAEFEREFAKYIGQKFCCAVNSGTSALICALTALKYKYKPDPIVNKILTTPLTFPATINAIILTGFEPVFVDVCRDTWVLDTSKVEEYLKNHDDVFAIIPVHLNGQACEMDKIMKLAKKYDVKVLEDSSQAHGSVYKGKKLGSYGELSTYSFYVAHNVQAGEMGAVLTSDPELYKLMKQIKAHGRMCGCPVCKRYEGLCPHKGKDYDPRFSFEVVGYNFKTTDFNTALALTQLKKIDNIIKKRQQNVLFLNENLPHSDLLELRAFNKDTSYLIYPMIVKSKPLFNRLRKELEEKGIETRPLYGCILDMPSFKKYQPDYEGELPNARFIGENTLYIGCHQYITEKDLKYIVKTFKEILI